MAVNNDFDFICQARDQYPQLSHASNVILKNNGNKTQAQEEALKMLIPQYANYLKCMLDIKDFDENSVRKKVGYLNAYYNFMHDRNLDGIFTSQGKFRPTILEEFLFLLFKDYVAKKQEEFDSEDVLNSGAVKAYSNIYFKAKNFEEFIRNPEIGVNEKDQDFAIYRTFDISINNADSLQVRIPAVAIEAKTYIDKTMLDSIVATAEKIKSGNPHTRFIAVAERYDVSYSVDPAYSRIDQIYVLRKSMRKGEWFDIDKNVVWRLFDETIEHLERPWADIKKRVEEDGVVI